MKDFPGFLVGKHSTQKHVIERVYYSSTHTHCFPSTLKKKGYWPNMSQSSMWKWGGTKSFDVVPGSTHPISLYPWLRENTAVHVCALSENTQLPQYLHIFMTQTKSHDCHMTYGMLILDSTFDFCMKNEYIMETSYESMLMSSLCSFLK